MCDPVSALMIAGTAVSAMGQIQSGMYASKVAKNQAIVAAQNKQFSRENAIDQIQLGQNEQRQLGREVGQRLGMQEARMSANNVDISFGSADRVIEDTKMIGAEDSAALAENTRRQVKGYQIDAWSYESARRAAKSESKQAIVGAAFGAASTVLGGATQYAKFKAGRG